MTTTSATDAGNAAIDAVLAASNTRPNDKKDGTAQGQQDKLEDKDLFLKLLVAQLKNQDPLNPADGLQFVSQLAEFTALEQSTQMRADLTAIREILSTLPADIAEEAAGTSVGGKETESNSTGSEAATQA